MGTDNQNNSNQADNQTPPKVTFTDEQQARVNELIQEAMGRAGAQHRQTAQEFQTKYEQATNDLSALRSELDQLKANPPKPGNKEDEKDYKLEVERLRTEFEQKTQDFKKLAEQKDQEAKQAKDVLQNVRKQVAMQSAATKLPFVNVDVVTKLTQDSIKWDDSRERFVVVNDNGTERMNAAFEPMSLDEYYTEFAAKNPYLVRGDIKPGSGSKEFGQAGVSGNGKYKVEDIFGPKSNGKLANDLKKSDPAEYQRLKAIAVEHGVLKG
jgi:DNA repair exonuclease SbcCD ATPase subunit